MVYSKITLTVSVIQGEPKNENCETLVTLYAITVENCPFKVRIQFL